MLVPECISMCMTFSDSSPTLYLFIIDFLSICAPVNIIYPAISTFAVQFFYYFFLFIIIIIFFFFIFFSARMTQMMIRYKKKTIPLFEHLICLLASNSTIFVFVFHVFLLPEGDTSVNQPIRLDPAA